MLFGSESAFQKRLESPPAQMREIRRLSFR
jgi:hypothetical protein